ncbi:PIG-L family deacetylase [Nafulsella turpanensis]|uniref:PIG-L family deacetylase n=1 Tax=Nafulsella turpanensis TaxID=1265690 RepID=UPI000348677C|nr:PIG-L family deacetylase [Nafulsella turpanensis]
MLKAIIYRHRMQVVVAQAILLLLFSPAFAQKPQTYSSADIAMELQALKVLGSVLYVAAHPDDENTRLITYLANEKKYRTGYLSLTRGDGGQNLIGPEMREKLGLIRTQELLQARRLDRGEQFFSRANDFGYSKNPDETFGIWDRDAVLADLVYVVRTFKPDVIITRFNTEAGTTHGHHTASAILAAEAFEAAADPNRFPEQLAYTSTWQPERLLWNTSSWFYRNGEAFDTTGLLKIDVGVYNPFLGKSYTEVAAESRSMHKSQGFGTPLQRGSSMEYLQPVLGDPAEKSLFEGINTSWSRVKGGAAVEKMIDKAIRTYQPAEPSALVPQLIEIYQAIESLPDQHYTQLKLQKVKQLILAVTGLYLEVVADEPTGAPGESLEVLMEAVNRSGVEVKLKQIIFPDLQKEVNLSLELEENQKKEERIPIVLPETVESSQPYWLKEPPLKGMFIVEDIEMIGKPVNEPALQANLHLQINGFDFKYTLPVRYKYTEPAEGEIYQPFFIVPPVAVNPKKEQLLFTGEEAQELLVEVRAGKDSVGGEVRLQLPEGWTATPAFHAYSLPEEGASQLFTFKVHAPEEAVEQQLQVIATYKNQSFKRGMEWIRYPHIPAQLVLPPAVVNLRKVKLATTDLRIGYLMGAGDEVPQSLKELGYAVELLQAQDLQPEKLGQYDAVVLGVRAFNTTEALKFRKDALEQYARDGGTVIIQYNTSFGLVDESIAPYPLQLSRERVTMEEAPVQLLQPNHPVFQYPNKISPEDFEGWVQERGLYFASDWSDEWTPLLSSHDTGEKPLLGGLLVAKVGEGFYVYTGYSWFRQLPAGVPGAIRLFVNLLSLGNS